MDELIKALRWIATNDEIVFNAEKAKEAANALESLQVQLAQVTAERDEYKGTLDSTNQTNAALARKALQIQVERDAAVKDIVDVLTDRVSQECEICAFYSDCRRNSAECEKDAIWRGLQKEKQK